MDKRYREDHCYSCGTPILVGDIVHYGGSKPKTGVRSLFHNGKCFNLGGLIWQAELAGDVFTITRDEQDFYFESDRIANGWQ